MLVLFDLDGTLTDPYEGITQSVLYALDKIGHARPGERELRRFIGPPLQDSFAARGLDDVDVQQAVSHYRERFAKTGLYENQVYAGIPEVLDLLTRAGVQMAVATSKPTEFATRILQHFDLAAHFDVVAGATLDGRRRAKPDIIAFALEHPASAPATVRGAVPGRPGCLWEDPARGAVHHRAPGAGVADLGARPPLTMDRSSQNSGPSFFGRVWNDWIGTTRCASATASWPSSHLPRPRSCRGTVRSWARWHDDRPPRGRGWSTSTFIPACRARVWVQPCCRPSRPPQTTKRPRFA